PLVSGHDDGRVARRREGGAVEREQRCSVDGDQNERRRQQTADDDPALSACAARPLTATPAPAPEREQQQHALEDEDERAQREDEPPQVRKMLRACAAWVERGWSALA